MWTASDAWSSDAQSPPASRVKTTVLASGRHRRRTQTHSSSESVDAKPINGQGMIVHSAGISSVAGCHFGSARRRQQHRMRISDLNAMGQLRPPFSPSFYQESPPVAACSDQGASSSPSAHAPQRARSAMSWPLRARPGRMSGLRRFCI